MPLSPTANFAGAKITNTPGTGGTSIVVDDITDFPDPGSTNYPAMMWLRQTHAAALDAWRASPKQAELVLVTGRDVPSKTLTVTRAQQGTSAIDVDKANQYWIARTWTKADADDLADRLPQQPSPGILRFDENLEIGGGEPWYDPKAFGALGDNVQDDTVFIQDRLNNAGGSNAGTILLPKGNFRITSTLTFFRTGVQLVGGGGGNDGMTTLIWDGTTTGDASTMMKVVAGNNGRIRNIHFDGDSKAKTALWFAASNAQISDFDVDACKIQRCTGKVIRLNDDSPTTNTITNLNFNTLHVRGGDQLVYSDGSSASEGIRFRNTFLVGDPATPPTNLVKALQGALEFDGLITSNPPDSPNYSIDVQTPVHIQHWISEDKLPLKISGTHNRGSTIRDCGCRSVDTTGIANNIAVDWNVTNGQLTIDGLTLRDQTTNTANVNVAGTDAPVIITGLYGEPASGTSVSLVVAGAPAGRAVWAQHDKLVFHEGGLKFEMGFDTGLSVFEALTGLRVKAAFPQLQLRDSDLAIATNPEGAWRIANDGGALKFNRNTHTSTEFQTEATDLEVNASGELTAPAGTHTLFATTVANAILKLLGNNGAGDTAEIRFGNPGQANAAALKFDNGAGEFILERLATAVLKVLSSGEVAEFFTVAATAPVVRIRGGDGVGETAKLVFTRDDAGDVDTFTIEADHDSELRIEINGVTPSPFTVGTNGVVGLDVVSVSTLLDFPSGGKISGPGATFIQWGTGSPEGAVFADRGSLFLRTDGGLGTSIYVKEEDDGLSTGWATFSTTPV